MSKKIFFIVLTCCLLVATFCVSFAGAPQVQSAPADIRAVLDRPDCASAPLIVPPVVEPLEDVLSGSSDDIIYDLSVYNDVTMSVDVDETLSMPAGLFSFSPLEFDGDFAFSTFYFLGFDTSEFSFTYEAFTQNDEPLDLSVYQLVHLPFDDVVFASDTLSLISADAYVDIYLPSDLSALIVFRASSSFLVSGVGDFHVYDLVSVHWVDPIIDILMSGLIGTGEAMGEAFSVLAESIFINADGTGLSTFGILVVVFVAVSLGLSLTRWVLNFCSSWGKRNR